MAAAHFGLLGAWGIVLLLELPLETLLPARAIRIHFRIDTLIEMPIVLAVLVTGGILLGHRWPPPPRLSAKIAAALIAIAFNLYCGVLVILRHRHRADDAAVRAYSRRIRITGLGLPFGVLAAILGWSA